MNQIKEYFWGPKPKSFELQDFTSLHDPLAQTIRAKNHMGDLVYTLQIVTLATTEVTSFFAKGAFSAALSLVSGIGITAYGAKGLYTNITKLKAEIEKADRNTFVLLSTAFKTIAYATWIITGISSIVYGIGYFLPFAVSGLQAIVQYLPYANVIAASFLVLMRLIDLYELYHAETIDPIAIQNKWSSLQSSITLLIAAIVFTVSDSLAPGVSFSIIIACALYSLYCEYCKTRLSEKPIQEIPFIAKESRIA